jgi:hypothetical protein
VALALLCGCEDEVTLSGGCDIRGRTCQRLIFDATADAREQPDAERPPVRTISLDELEVEYRAAVDDAELRTERQAAWDAALQLLGLLAADTEIVEAVVNDTLDTLQAYYDDDAQRITIVDRGEPDTPEEALFTLSHEFAHALQDQRGQLGQFRDDVADSTDSSVAATTLIEGEATVLAAAVLERAAPPGRFLDVPAFKQGVASQLFAVIEDSPEPFFAAISSLPYTVGLDRLEPIWRIEGQQAIEALYEAPVLNMRYWEQWPRDRDEAPAALSCQPTGVPEGYTAVDHDRLGAIAPMALQILAGAGAQDAWQRALAWSDDRVVVSRADDDPDAYAVAWRIRFDDASGVAWLLDAYENVTAVRTLAEDDELLVYAASDGAVADAWSPQDTCGTPGELPEDEQEPDGSMLQALRRASRW